MHRALSHPIGLALAVGVGFLSAVQSRINGELAVRLEDGALAALISFGSGLAIISVVVLARPAARAGVASLPSLVRAGRLRWWHLVGGAGGATFVLGQGISVPVLGVAVFTVAVIAGQSGSSLAVDRAGLGPAGPQAITRQRISAAVLATIAVLVAVSSRLGDGSLDPPYLLLAVVAGVVIAAQQAVNGRVSNETRQPFAATFANFTVGTACLTAVLGVAVLIRGWAAPELPPEPWLYLGGLIGVVFVAVAALVVPVIGVLGLALASIAGQLAGALLLDAVAPTTGQGLQAATAIGALLAFAAVFLGSRR